MAEKREADAFDKLAEKEKQVKEKEKEVQDIKLKFSGKEAEINELNKQMLKIQDEKLDQEAKLESNEGKEHILKEEIVVL